MPSKKELTGKRFGKLTVIRETGKKNGVYMWECICDCGNNINVRGHELTRGHTKSCGCLKKERITEYNTTHGLSYTRLYTIWCGIKERCYTPTATNYKFYGAKGVSVCQEWLNDFQVFYDWAITHGYKDNLTIDRKDSDGDYCPENCQWITQSENATRANNKRWAVPTGIKVTACKK